VAANDQEEAVTVYKLDGCAACNCLPKH